MATIDGCNNDISCLLHCFQQCMHNLLVNGHRLYSSHPQIIALGYTTTLVINTALM